MRTRLLSAGFAVAVAAAGVVVPASTAQAAVSPVRFVAISYDPPGTDVRTTTQLNREWIQVRNFSSVPRNLGGWRIRDAANHTFVFPSGYILKAGTTVTVHTGKGTNKPTSLYWQQGNYVWNNTGDNARLQTPSDTVIDRCSYVQVRNRVQVPC